MPRTQPITTINREIGFTLLELMVVIAISLIITLFALPSFQANRDKERYKQSYLMLLNDLKYAKNYSNREQSRVSICPSRDGLHCLKEPKNWHHGWILFDDPYVKFSPKADTILRYTAIKSPVKALTILPSDHLMNGFNLNRYRRYGRSLDSGLVNGTFTICASNQKRVNIIINLFGNARLATTKKDCT